MPPQRPRSANGNHKRQHGSFIGRKHDSQTKKDDGQRHEKPQPSAAVITEKPRCRFHADQGIVFCVLMRIDRIVKKCPCDTGHIKNDGHGPDAVGMRSPGKQSPPVEGQPQKHLRPPCKAFCERIDRHRHQCRDAQNNRCRVKADQDEECQERLNDHPDQRTFDADLARGDGPRACPRDRSVNVAVRDVVPRAARTPHQECPDPAAHNRPKIMPAVAVCREDRQGQTPQAGRIKQPCSDRPVRPAEPQIGAAWPRCETVHPIVFHGVGDSSVRLWHLGFFGHMLRFMASKVRLYVDHPLGEGQSVPLSREQANYLFAVMRLDEGTVLSLINGADGEWDAEVVQASKKGGILLCRSQTRPLQLPPDIWLLFAPIRKERTAFIVEKAVELGVARILPVQTDYTQSVNRIRQDKLQAHAVEAAEQCGGTFVPPVGDLRKLDRLLADWPQDRQLMFCDEVLIGDPVALTGKGGPWAILIGPEGGFSPAERDRLRALPFAHPVSLGPRILRADTAAVVALTLWQQALGDW